MTVHLTRLLRRFGHAATRTGRLLVGLAGLTEAERALLVELNDLVRRGVRLTAAQAANAADLLARVVTQYRVRMLISEAENAFRVPGLQEIFLRETQHLGARPSVTDWIRNLDEASEAYDILRWLCGRTFRAQADLTQGLGSRLISVFSVPAPRHMRLSPEAAINQLLEIPGASRVVFDRMRSLFNTSHRSAAAALLASGRISRGLFSVLKGNVAELLARNEIMDVLRRGEHFALPEGAVLVTGARVRLPGSTRSMLFTDGLVGVMEGDTWRWIAAVEVKSYDAGFADGVAQVTRWGNVSSFTSGFTLQFRQGTTVTRIADGVVQDLPHPRSFGFDPAATVNGVIRGDDGIRHIVVAPAGTSRFDLSVVAPAAPAGIILINHPVATDSIDHVTALLLQTVAGETSVAAAEQALRNFAETL